MMPSTKRQFWYFARFFLIRRKKLTLCHSFLFKNAGTFLDGRTGIMQKVLPCGLLIVYSHLYNNDQKTRGRLSCEPWQVSPATYGKYPGMPRPVRIKSSFLDIIDKAFYLVDEKSPFQMIEFMLNHPRKNF